jgi:DNA-binding NtrC family response regulator
MEARRYKPSRCTAHLRIAEHLLSERQNVFQMARLEQVRSNLAALSSDLRGALDAAHRCASFARAAGWKAGLTGVLGNIAQFRLALGDIGGAEQILQDASRSVHGSKVVELAAKDTRLQLLIASESSEANGYAEELWHGDFSGEWRYSYYGLWHHLTRVRLLINEQRLDEAAALVREAIPYIKEAADEHLMARMRLLGAEVDTYCGNHLRAAREVATIYATCDELSLESFAELQRIVGLIADADQAPDPAFIARADRLYSSAGLETARKQLTRRGSSLSTDGRMAPPSVASDGQSVLHALCALIWLANNPSQCAEEALRLVERLGIANWGAKVATSSDGSDIYLAEFGQRGTNAGETLHRLSFGAEVSRSFSLVVVLKECVDSLLTWHAIRYLATASVQVGAARTRVREAAPLWPEETPEQQLGMVVAAQEMLELINTTRRLAPSPITVLITGETGTGKELLARALHDASPRKDKPFIPFNCSAVARDMLDAQLFGYRRGAFTGAHDAFQGVIRAAAGGTLFLDEIGEITPEVQPKLLRFLESNEIHPLGEAKPLKVDVRVVAATNANLEQMVAEGRFREDLFYRLNVVRLDVPPLRDRREEIPLLVQHYLDKHGRDAHKLGLRVAQETMEYLILYRWPGNVRQIGNEIRRLVALAEPGAVLMPEHLSPELAASRRTIPASERDLAPTEFVVRLDQPLPAAMEHVERAMIQHALRLAGHRLEEAAQMLGLSRKGLYLKRQRLGIDTDTPPKPTST